MLISKSMKNPLPSNWLGIWIGRDIAHLSSTYKLNSPHNTTQQNPLFRPSHTINLESLDMLFGVLYPRAFYYYHQTKTTKCHIFICSVCFLGVYMFIAAISSLSENISRARGTWICNTNVWMSVRFVLWIVLYHLYVELRSAVVSNWVFVFDMWGLKVRIWERARW